jgi:hypothetical protein
MTIGGWEVSYDLVRYFAMNYMSDYGDLTPEDFQQDEELQAELEKNVMSSLSQLAAYSQLAKKYNLSLSSSDKAQVESEIQEIRDSYDSTAEYKQALADNFVTEDVLRTIHQISLLCDSSNPMMQRLKPILKQEIGFRLSTFILPTKGIVSMKVERNLQKDFCNAYRMEKPCPLCMMNIELPIA